MDVKPKQVFSLAEDTVFTTEIGEISCLCCGSDLSYERTEEVREVNQIDYSALKDLKKQEDKQRWKKRFRKR